MHRHKSPVRPSIPNPSGQPDNDVFLLSNTEENAAKAALGHQLEQILKRYSNEYGQANLRLIPAGPNERNTDYYIFPFTFDHLHDTASLTDYLAEQLAEALDGRKVQMRVVHELNGRVMFFIDISTRKPTKPVQERAGYSWTMIVFMLVFLAGLIGYHQLRMRD